MYKKPILSACDAPWLPPPPPKRMVWWEGDERETLKKRSIPFCRRGGGGGGEGSEWKLLTQQEMSRHIHTVVFPLCTWLLPNAVLKVTLQPIWFRRERCLQKLTTFLLSPLIVFFASLWWQLRLQSFAASFFFFKKVPSFSARLFGWWG